MLTKNEILTNFLQYLKLASLDYPEASFLAQSDPLAYLKSKYVAKLEFNELTEKALNALKEQRPGLYFDAGLYKRKVLEPKKLEFANELINKDPVNALLYYKFHRKKEFGGLNPGLFTSLRDGGLEKYGKSMESLVKEDGIIFKEVLYLVEDLARNHPWYYLGNKLADLNSEFAKYFNLVTLKNK